MSRSVFHTARACMTLAACRRCSRSYASP